MKPLALLVMLCTSLCTYSAFAASPCMMTALHDTHAVEDPSAVWKKGVRNGPVTELVIQKKTGRQSYCIHGDYCYLAYVNLNGQQVEALHMGNCRKQPGDTGGDDSEELVYGLEAIPARAPAASSPTAPTVDIKTVRGECTRDSFAAAGPIGEDLSDRMGRFACNGAVFFFHDHQNKRVTIRFMDADHWKEAGVLGFTGVMASDGVTLNVTGLHYMDPNGQAWSVEANSRCELEFAEEHISAIQCAAQHRSAGTRYIAVVAFLASSGQ